VLAYDELMGVPKEKIVLHVLKLKNEIIIILNKSCVNEKKIVIL